MSVSGNKRKNLKKYRRKKNIRKIFGLLFILLLCLYIPILVIIAATSRPEWEFLRIGTIRDSFRVDGLVIRDEIVFQAEFDGVFQRNAAEGQRVPAGHTVALVVNRQHMETFREIQQLRSKIILLHSRTPGTSGIFTRDLKLINDQLSLSAARIAEAASRGDLTEFNDEHSAMYRHALERNHIMSGSYVGDDYMRELVQKANQLEETVKDHVMEIKTSNPGFVSYRIDGLEDVITPDKVLTLSPGEVSSFIRSPGEIRQEGEIRMGEAFLKVSRDDSFLLGFVLDRKRAQFLEKESNLIMEMRNSGMRIRLGEMVTGQTEGDLVTVFFRVDNRLGDLSGVRTVSGDIVITEYRGLKVPSSALANTSFYPFQQIQIAVIRDIWIRFMDAEVVHNDGTHAIIRSIDNRFSLFDKYILRPDKVEEGQTIR